MEQIVTTIAKELVEYPEHVSVTAAQDAQLVYITLRVDPRDMGKVIGKRGRTQRQTGGGNCRAALRTHQPAGARRHRLHVGARFAHEDAASKLGQVHGSTR